MDHWLIYVDANLETNKFASVVRLSDFAIQLISEFFFKMCSGKGSVEFGLSLIDFV